MCPARRPWRSIGLFVILAVLAAAFGAAASAQVATLGSPAPEASVAPASPAPDGQQSLLDWAACMRENGVEMDDPRFGLEGELIGGLGKDGSGSRTDIESETYQLAAETCAELLREIKAPADPEQQAERAEAMLAWAACMREAGLDIPDPDADGTFSGSDWKLDLKGNDYTAADEACREPSGMAAGK
jgi:hypothetical protein